MIWHVLLFSLCVCCDYFGNGTDDLTRLVEILRYEAHAVDANSQARNGVYQCFFCQWPKLEKPALVDRL